MGGRADHEVRAELSRVARVTDLMCTAHAGLRDRYSRLALLLDLSILLGSAWLLALAFIDPQINLSLTPFGFVPRVWSGLLACGIFALSVIQLRVDWKGLASAHSFSFSGYAAIKREASELLGSDGDLDEKACRALFARYRSAGSVSIPEREFLAQKKRHVIKIELSKHLDRNPGASILWAKIRIFFRDNSNRLEKKQ